MIQQWSNKPIYISYNDIKTQKLILSLQLWSDRSENYSEFIIAQLLRSTFFIKQQNIK